MTNRQQLQMSDAVFLRNRAEGVRNGPALAGPHGLTEVASGGQKN